MPLGADESKKVYRHSRIWFPDRTARRRRRPGLPSGRGRLRCYGSQSGPGRRVGCRARASLRCRRTGSTSQGSCWPRTRGAFGRPSSATDARSTKTRPCTSKSMRSIQSRCCTPAAAYIGASPEEIALTDSTTMGLAIALCRLAARGSADDVLTTTHDHYSTHESLRLAGLRAGAVAAQGPALRAAVGGHRRERWREAIARRSCPRRASSRSPGSTRAPG